MVHAWRPCVLVSPERTLTVLVQGGGTGGQGTFFCHQMSTWILFFFYFPLVSLHVRVQQTLCCVVRSTPGTPGGGSRLALLLQHVCTAARNPVDISRCCRPVNKTLTCTLLSREAPCERERERMLFLEDIR